MSAARAGRAGIADPDAFYEALIEAHRGLSDDESRRLNARLILILADRVGDLETLREALALARRTGGAAAPGREDPS